MTVVPKLRKSFFERLNAAAVGIHAAYRRKIRSSRPDLTVGWMSKKASRFIATMAVNRIEGVKPKEKGMIVRAVIKLQAISDAQQELNKRYDLKSIKPPEYAEKMRESTHKIDVLGVLIRSKIGRANEKMFWSFYHANFAYITKSIRAEMNRLN